MPRKLKQVIFSWWLLGTFSIMFDVPAYAESFEIEQVLGIDKSQLAELVKGHPIADDLKEGSNELAVGLIWYFSVPLERVNEKLRLQDPDLLDIDVTANGILGDHSGIGSLKSVIFSKEEAQDLLEAEPGDEFNLSTHEIEKLKAFKHGLKRTPQRALEDAASEYFREILLQRFDAYRRGGINAITPYVRKHNTEYSSPSIELRQAAEESDILSRYFPDIFKVWLGYPKPLPAGVSEAFPWVEKNVEGRPGIILRHRLSMDWNGGLLVLTREYYTPHSYNSSQWITGSLPYRDGTVVFQQVRSFTDQVAGTGSMLKHLVGRELLQDKMLKSFERLCEILGHCN